MLLYDAPICAMLLLRMTYNECSIRLFQQILIVLLEYISLLYQCYKWNEHWSCDSQIMAQAMFLSV